MVYARSSADCLRIPNGNANVDGVNGVTFYSAYSAYSAEQNLCVDNISHTIPIETLAPITLEYTMVAFPCAFRGPRQHGPWSSPQKQTVLDKTFFTG